MPLGKSLAQFVHGNQEPAQFTRPMAADFVVPELGIVHDDCRTERRCAGQSDRTARIGIPTHGGQVARGHDDPLLRCFHKLDARGAGKYLEDLAGTLFLNLGDQVEGGLLGAARTGNDTDLLAEIVEERLHAAVRVSTRIQMQLATHVVFAMTRLVRGTGELHVVDIVWSYVLGDDQRLSLQPGCIQ